jgi:inner membrane protein
LQDLVDRKCEAAAFMQFARAPWAAAADETTQSDDDWLLGDLRFDREASLTFAEFRLMPGADRCPRHVPPWLPPRGDQLRR